MASEKKNIPKGYKEVEGIVRTDDEYGTPLKWKDCKKAEEKIRWHQLQAEKIRADEAKRERRDRNHRLIENAAYIEYAINAKLIGEDEAGKRKKASDYEIKLDDDKQLAKELVSLYVDAHQEKFAIAENADKGRSQFTVIENFPEGR